LKIEGERKTLFRNFIIKDALLFTILLSLITSNFIFSIIAEENESIIKQINDSFTPSLKRKENIKIESSIVKLLDSSQNIEKIDRYELNQFDFVENKVRLEIILTNEECLDMLTNFNENIVVECNYNNLAQVLIPIALIRQLSEEGYVKYIRPPVKPNLDYIISEGVSVIEADLVHAQGYYGEGVKIAIIDVGFTNYNINPEIPSERIKEVKSFRSDGQIEIDKHGCACAEIVLDVAPLADLYLYVISTDVEFCNAVNYSVTQGINIISISLGFFNVNDLDGNGSICEVVNNARSAGILVTKSAGNYAEKHYCGEYADLDGDDRHDFDTGNNNLTLRHLPENYSIDLYLSWNDWPYSDQDYDLYLVDSNNNTIAVSNNTQSGSQPPTEFIFVEAPDDDVYYVEIKKYNATSSVRFQLFSNYCYFDDNVHRETSLSCPADANGSMTVGATYWQNDKLEDFSSRGPTNDRRIKPDVTAPDGISTWVYYPGSFKGTSASAPHTAGAAALLLSLGPLCTADDLQNILERTALDLGSSGKDNLYGSGRINVWDAYISMKPTANFTYIPTNPKTNQNVTFTDTSIDPDGNITSWNWTFGDNNTSTLQNPTHKYTDSGTYTITLNITDDDGATNKTEKQITIINVKPTANDDNYTTN